MRLLKLLGLAGLVTLVVVLITSRRTDPEINSQALVPSAGADKQSGYAEPLVQESSVRAAIEGRRLLIRVRDSGGGEIPRAKFEVDGIQAAAILSPDEHATGWILDPRPHIGSEILVSAEGYIPKTITAPPLETALIEVMLDSTPRIEGRVLINGDRAVGAGVTVLALSERENWSAKKIQEALHGAVGLNRGVTDESGTFSIDLASSDGRFNLIAGGMGFVCPNVLNGKSAGDRHAVIVVERAYAKWLRIRGAGGVYPRIPRELSGFRYATAKPVLPGPKFLPGNSPQLALAASTESFAETSIFDRLYVYLSPYAEDQIGPLSISVDWPGYEPTVATFMVPALGDPIENELIELRPNTDCLSTVHVSWSGLPAELPISGSLEPSGYLHLESPVAGTLDLAVRSFAAGDAPVGDLPCGDYRVWFTAGSLPVRGEPQHEATVMQLKAEAIDLSFDLSDKGWAIMEFKMPDGTPYEGRASVLYGHGPVSHGFASQQVRVFASPPYVLGPLEPGTYSAYLDLPRMGDRSSASARGAAVEFVVLPGSVTGARSHLSGRQ